MKKMHFLLGLALAGLGLITPALSQARTNVDVHIGLPLPVVVEPPPPPRPPVVYIRDEPRPHYYGHHHDYWRPAPPPPPPYYHHHRPRDWDRDDHGWHDHGHGGHRGRD